MPVTNKNIPFVHRKEWQMMALAPAASQAGSFMITDTNEEDKYALFVQSATAHYLYNREEDSWIQIQSGALGGTFGAGSCGGRNRWSATITATGGSTTSAITTAAISSLAIGKMVRFLTGLNAGLQAVCTGAIINPGGTSTLQFGAISFAVANTDTFIVETGRFFVFNAGAVAAGSFKWYDVLTGTWSATPTITGLPGTWATDGKLIAPASNDVFASGTATSATTTTLANTPKAWTVNQWANYQVRITAGTGIGQFRIVASNTANTITVAAVWTVTPDATSIYEITANDDYLYLLGNAAVTIYRYSISANTWTTLAPTTARNGAPAVGMSGNWIGKTGDAGWGTESTISDGRFIFSFRGGGGNVLDRYDIANNTWAQITYINNAETFGTGCGYAANGRFLFIRKDSTHRYFKYDLAGNVLDALSINLYSDNTGVVGDKVWISVYREAGVTKMQWLYSLRNTGNELHRLLLY